MQRGSLVSSPPRKGTPGSLKKLLRLSLPDGIRALFWTLPLVLYSATTRLISSNSTLGLPAIEASCPTHRPWSGGWTRTPAMVAVSRPLSALKLCSIVGELDSTSRLAAADMGDAGAALFVLAACECPGKV